MSQDDAHYIRRALRLAARGRGFVEPNPMVGAVLVRDGRIVGEGWHQRFGAAHAEIEALREAGEAAGGATLYVTLEPCCHQGKTPPCTAAIREAGVARVVAAMVDPFPEVSGRGLGELERAGVATQVGPLTHRAMRLNEPFIKRLVTGTPFVIAKWAATLDGAIATATGHSQWISNPRSRRRVHLLRSRVDAVIVGIGTALADDPLLTARDVPLRRVARRVVIDPRLQLPPESALVRTAADVPLLIATAAERVDGETEQVRLLREAGVELLPLPSLPAQHESPPAEGTGSGPGRSRRSGQGPAPGPGPTARPASPRRRLDMDVLLRHLAAAHDATNVLIEGGAGTHGAFFEQQLVDEVWAFVAPRLLGQGRHLPPLHTGRATYRVDHAISLKLRHVRRLGDDVLLRYRTHL